MSTPKSSHKVTAHYSSPNGIHDISYDVPGGDNLEQTDSKTAYLHELRKRTVQLQGQINEFLTQKMEEDKQAEAAAAEPGSTTAAAEAKARKEEENYGEEVVDEDS